MGRIQGGAGQMMGGGVGIPTFGLGKMQPQQQPQQPQQQGGFQMGDLPNLIAALGGAFRQQQQPQQQQGGQGQVSYGPGGQWGYMPQQPGAGPQMAASQAAASRYGADTGALMQHERNPWDALRQMISSYPGVYGPAVQGTTAQNITQMNNEFGMNKLRQILPFLQAMQGGVQTNYGAGIQA